MNIGSLVRFRAPTSVALAFSLALGCQKTTPEPEPTREQPAAEAAAATPVATAATTASPSAAPVEKAASSAPPAPPPGPRTTPVASVPVSPDDPLAGKFSLEEATKGLTGTGALYAEIQTELGKLECELYEDKAPITVANFVGLARGLRPFKQPDGKWAKKNGYDGTTFHRVIKGFMIQGGDPLGSGAGEPGYVIPDEIWEGAKHDERGQLCMANRGKNTNGMQFFIMDGVAKHLDGGYTIFGKCAPEEVITKLSSAEVQGDRSVKPTKINKVIIKRKPKKSDKPDAAAKPSTPAAPAPAAPAPAAPKAAPVAPATPAPAPAE
ncbi:MAG: Peptidyl-prolyl cis-trans isomerase [Polyangiaceae bacterium]|jgi:peptidyl-prolyl cis-trans isomerase A (cyclophilin A)|nr:Peptidyl-prolyl cis-trans isomerase [Polyangiaceae bacterium]